MGPFATPNNSQLNVEGRGFGGARSLAKDKPPFGTLQVIEVVISPASRTVSLTADGTPADSRPFEPSTLKLDELTVGARYYNLFSPEQNVTGWINADIAEIALYSRELSADERAAVRDHLLAKHEEPKRDLPATLRTEGRLALENIPNPPPVQMFVPGFEVRELPLKLPNINNVRYRPDGTLLALAYDGDIYLLSDTSGDGLEDRAELFWDNTGRVRSPIGMALTPPGYRLGDGLFVATKSECLLLADTGGFFVPDENVQYRTPLDEGVTIARIFDLYGTLLQEIKTDDDLKRIPVVVLTTSEAEEDILRSYDLHANAYVTKPVDFDAFVKVVRQVDDFYINVVRLPPK